MKKKFYLVLLLGISFLILVNCAEPELEKLNPNLEEGVPFGKKPLSIKKVDAETVVKNPKMQKMMRNIEGKKLARAHKNGRILENTGYFKLQMTNIVMIEENGYTSYTFAVLRDEEQEFMENIVVNLYADGSVKTYFVEYEYTEVEKMALELNNIIPTDTKGKAYLIDNLEDIFTNNDILRVTRVNNEIMCPEVTTTYTPNTCPQGHDASNYQSANNGNGCQYFIDGSWNPFPPFFTSIYVTYVPCGGGTGITPNPPLPIPDNGGGQPGGGGGSPTPPEEPEGLTNPELADEGSIKTVPVRPRVTPQEIHEKNCEKLGQMVADTLIKNSLINLQGKVGEPREYGYSYSLEPSSQPIEAPLHENNNLMLNMPFGGQIYGFSHTHPYETGQGTDGNEKGLPMFSIGDIFSFARLVQTHTNINADPHQFFLTLTVKNGSSSDTYVLKIENKISFIYWAGNYSNLSVSDKITKNERLADIFSKRDNNGGGSSGYLTDLLKFMTNQNINGVGIYKATDDSLTNWSKIKLNTNQSNVEEEPCN